MTRSRQSNLFSPVLLACKLHLAHTASTDCLSENPFAGLSGNGSSRCPLLGTRGTSIGGRAVVAGSSGSGHVAVVGGVIGAGAGATMDALGVGTSGDRGRAVFAGASVWLMGYGRGFIVQLWGDVWDCTDGPGTRMPATMMALGMGG